MCDGLLLPLLQAYALRRSLAPPLSHSLSPPSSPPPPPATTHIRCVPSLLSREALLIAAQTGLLVSRTLLSDYVARMEGYCARAITSLVRCG